MSNDVQPPRRRIFAMSVLVDAGALIALVDKHDDRHEDASVWFQLLHEEGYELHIIPCALAEAHKLIRYERGYDLAMRLLDLVFDGQVQIFRLNDDDQKLAVGYLKRFRGQALSLTDALNLLALDVYGFGSIFAFDHHMGLLGHDIFP